MYLVAFLPWFTEIQQFVVFWGGGFLKFFPFGVWVCHPSTLLSYVFGRLCEFATLKPIAIPLVRPEKRLQDHLEGRIWLVYCITTIFAQRALNLTSTFYSLFLICNLFLAGTLRQWIMLVDFPFKSSAFSYVFLGFLTPFKKKWIVKPSTAAMGHDHVPWSAPFPGAMLSGGSGEQFGET